MFRKSIFLIGILSLTAMVLFAQRVQDEKKDEKKSAKIIGFLVDVHCATGLDVKDREHTVSCALMPGCAASGYAVVSKDIVYKLDDNGNKLALEVLKKTKLTKGLGVTAVGTLKEGVLYVDTLTEVPSS